MSAENAWRIAREQIALEFADVDLTAHLDSLPMPPAFRAEVEAETRAIKELSLSFFVEQATAVADELLAAGLINSTVRSIRIEEARIMAAEALSSLEAKGESHDAG